MAYTYEEVQAAIEQQINYAELALLLETDLNAIADQIIVDDPSGEYVSFKVFFDSGEFNTTIEDASIGEGDGFNVTPVLLKFVNGDYSSARGPQFFSTVFSIEVFGFEKDREKLRQIFETYSYLNQGRIDNEEIGIYTTRTLEFPVFEDPVLWKGSTRFQGFMRLFMTYMYDGQLSNGVLFTVDGEPLIVQSLNLRRIRTPKAGQKNEQQEVVNIYESQILTITGGMLFDNSTAAIVLLNELKTLNRGLNTQHTLTVTYPVVSATPDTYKMYLDNGDIGVNEGGVITLSFVFALAEV
jgi:hypothetical protein